MSGEVPSGRDRAALRALAELSSAASIVAAEARGHEERTIAEWGAREAYNTWREELRRQTVAEQELARKHLVAAAQAGEEWDEATAILERLVRLPQSHGVAVLRLAYGLQANGPQPTGELLIRALGPRPEPHHHTLPAPGAWADLTALDAALHHVTPPESECTPTGTSLARGWEVDIAEAAEAAADDWRAFYTQRTATRAAAGLPLLPDGEDEWISAERMDPNWHRRKLRRESRRAMAWYDAALRMAGPRSPSVSNYLLKASRQTWDRGRMWAAGMTVAFETGATVPLETVQERARNARRAQLYTVAKAMEHEGERRGFQAFFITLTLPGAYHPYSTGEQAADGSYPDAGPNPNWKKEFGPTAQWEELQRRWALARAMLAKFNALREWWGISVPEPHQDGTPHLHAMVWLPRGWEEPGTGGEAIRRRQTAHVLRDILHAVAPGRQGRLEIVRKRPDRTRRDGTVQRYANPSTYVMKYVLMSLDDQATQSARGEDAERHRSWASSRGLRRMRLVGVHGTLRIWQRLWTAGADDYDALPPTAQTAWDSMRRSEELAAVAEMVADTQWESEAPAMRRHQASAAADALREIGGLPGAQTRLRLGYEETETQYGRPSQRPASIVEEIQETVEETYTTPARGLLRTRMVTRWNPTGQTMPLRRQNAVLVPTAEVAKLAGRNPVTVVAIVPRAGADAPSTDIHLSDADDLALATAIEALIRNRDGQPAWEQWCDDRRAYVHRLRTGGASPPADER